MQYDTIIIGGGISALSAAVYCGRFQLKTLVIGEKIGGNIILTESISNYPGFKKISGMDLFDKIKEHALEYKIDLVGGKVDKVKKVNDYFEVSAKEKVYKVKAIIFATGTDWRKLDVPGEKKFANKGVHYCALCDGAFYKNKAIGVVGGSDSAAKEALLLSEYVKKVYIIYRKGRIRAEPIILKRVQENQNIEIIYDTNVVEIKGNKFVNSIMMDKPYRGSKELKLDGLFVAIGRTPISDIAKSIAVRTNKKGEIITDKNTGATNIKGVYACGDVADNKFKQAITAVAGGVIAANSVYRFIKNEMPVLGSSEDS